MLSEVQFRYLYLLRMIDQMPSEWLPTYDFKLRMNLHSTFQFKGRFSPCQESHWLYWFWKIVESLQYLFTQTSISLNTVCLFFFFDLGVFSIKLSVSIKTENQGPLSVIKLMPTLLRWIKVSKVNSEKKHNLKLSRSSWEIHLWYFCSLNSFLRIQHHLVQHHHHHHH